MIILHGKEIIPVTASELEDECLQAHRGRLNCQMQEITDLLPLEKYAEVIELFKAEMIQILEEKEVG